MMSDFYKCEHGQQMCGTCTRGLKVQYDALEKKVEKLREALESLCYSVAGTEGTKTNSELPEWYRNRLKDAKAALSDGS